MADLTFVNYQSKVLRIVFFCLINYLIWSGMLIQINDYFLIPLKLSLESPRTANPEVWLPHILRTRCRIRGQCGCSPSWLLPVSEDGRLVHSDSWWLSWFAVFGEMGFPGCSHDEESACNAGDLGLIPGSGRSPWSRKWQPTPYSWLEKSMDRGAWRATAHGVTKSQTWLSTHTSTTFFLCVCMCIIFVYVWKSESFCSTVEISATL